MRSLTRVCVLAALLVSCTSPNAAATLAPSASATASIASTTPTPARGLASAPRATIAGIRHWYTVPDALTRDQGTVAVTFGADATAGEPRVRLRSTGKTAPLVPDTTRTGADAQWLASPPLDGATPGAQSLDAIVRLRDGSDAVVASASFTLSQPEYVIWTLDFEGDAAGDDALAMTAAIADGLGIRGTIMWNSRAWTTPQVAPERADAMVAWTRARAAKGDEVALHVHAWTDFVRDAGVTPRTAPNWSGRSDGYDVPLTAFDESETRKLIDRAVELMTAHGLPRPTSFRAGGLFANAANLRAISAAGFTVDSSAAPAGGFGRLPLPWTLAKDAQPYRPSRDDANATGDLPLLEAPNIAGNTYALTVNTIQPTIRDDLAMLAPAGQPATARRALTLVSHPATVDGTERAAIEALFKALAPLRYDSDAGPLRFITLAQLAKAYSP